MKDNRLAVSEVFYSLQGEGSTMGIPSVFLRLKGCNMICGGNQRQNVPGATWRCDTIAVWMQGEKMEHGRVLRLEHVSKLKAGAHLVITGGEPLMQQEQLANYLSWFGNQYGFMPFIEIETNGTIKPIREIRYARQQFNVSPKLSNSGVKESTRLKPPILGWFDRDGINKTIFKFVITRQEDWDEIEDVYLSTFLIRKENIWLMPGADNIDQLLDRNHLVAAIALHHGVNFCSRLQVEIWNKTVGV